MQTKMFIYGRNGLQPAQDSKLALNQIFFLNGYGQDEVYHERKAVYEITNCGFDGAIQYKYVNLDKPERGIANAFGIKPIAEKFGIGLYYHPDQFATPEEITNALQEAMEAERRALSHKELAKIEADLVRERGEEIFKANWPDKEPVGVIVAELHENESDLHTDYYASKTVRTVILAFTFTKRHNFKEMRKAAQNCPIADINRLAIAPDEDSNGSPKTDRNKDWWTPADEHRDNYSGGSGTWLGYRRHSGWQIRKCCYHEMKSWYYDAGKNDGFYAFK